MANETNFTGYVEKYVVDEIRRLTAENARLLKENEALKLENNQVDENKTISFPTLGVGFDISNYDWYIKRENIQDYKNAMVNKDFDWLEHHEYEIRGRDWNYEIHLGRDTVHLNLYYNKTTLECNVVNPEFKTLEEAQKALLTQLNKDISAKEAQFRDEDAKAKQKTEGGE